MLHSHENNHFDWSPQAMLIYYRIIIGLVIIALIVYYVLFRNLTITDFTVAIAGLFGLDRFVEGVLGRKSSKTIDTMPRKP